MENDRLYPTLTKEAPEHHRGLFVNRDYFVDYSLVLGVGKGMAVY